MMITKTGTEYAGITDNVLDYSLSTKRFEKRIMKFTANLSLAGILFWATLFSFLGTSGV
jgi:hypothetical protein